MAGDLCDFDDGIRGYKVSQLKQDWSQIEEEKVLNDWPIKDKFIGPWLNHES